MYGNRILYFEVIFQPELLGLTLKSDASISHLNVKVSTETPKNVIQKFVHLNFSVL